MNKKIEIIYILSASHSGSTLLDLLLGSHSQIHSGGEIIRTRTRRISVESKLALSMQRGEGFEQESITNYCSCGLPFEKCTFWAKVTKQYESLNKIDESKSLENEASSIISISGKKFLCDSSKNLQRCKEYLSNDRFIVHIIHLVRDPRAVGYSLKRKGISLMDKFDLHKRHEMGYFLRNTLKKRKNPYRYFYSIRQWVKKNNNCLREFNAHDNYLLIKYEDLTSNPKETLTKLLNHVGLNFEEKMLDYHEFEHHIFEGNRMRLEKKPIMRDTEYLHQLSFFEWLLGTIAAFPLLIKFKYPLFRNQPKNK